MSDDTCKVCTRKVWRVNGRTSECSYATCPHRPVAWSDLSDILTVKTIEPVVHPRCPWCGLRGVDFDESPKPSSYCHHDPADIQ